MRLDKTSSTLSEGTSEPSKLSKLSRNFMWSDSFSESSSRAYKVKLYDEKNTKNFNVKKIEKEPVARWTYVTHDT